MQETMSKFRGRLKEVKNVSVIAGAGRTQSVALYDRPQTYLRQSRPHLVFLPSEELVDCGDAMMLCLWRRLKPFARTPGGHGCFNAFYEYRRRKALSAEPNAAHIALARFADPSIRQSSAPACRDFAFGTQNVDGLSSRAFGNVQGGSHAAQVPVLEMHGNILKPYCTKCKKVTPHYEDKAITPALAKVVQEVDARLPEIDIPKSELPHCLYCGGLLRPGVVWFGEMPKYLDEIDAILRKTELLLVIGTSSVVYPAAGFADRVKRAGGEIAVFNIEPLQGDEQADYVFYGPCEETLPKALGVE